VGVYMEPRGRWTEKVWEPLLYSFLTIVDSLLRILRWTLSTVQDILDIHDVSEPGSAFFIS
jgi:hypothetical protein